jgi:WD40 repeat protein
MLAPPPPLFRPAPPQLTYWDAFDCQAIRVLEASATGQVNVVVLSPDGEAALTGGADKLVRLWGWVSALEGGARPALGGRW